MKIRKAIIPAAGLGTRMRPITNVIPKEMLPIMNRPAISYVIEEALLAGIEEIGIIINDSKEIIKQYMKEYKCIKYICQDEPKGLGHAVLCAEEFIDNEPFAVLLPDEIIYNEIPCTKQLIDIYNVCALNSVIGVQKVRLREVSKYGIIKLDDIDCNGKTFKVSDLVEKPEIFKAPSTFAIMGRYILNPRIFNMLKRTKPGKNNEIQLTDALRELLLYEEIYAYSFDGERFDTGNFDGLLEANIYYKNMKNNKEA